MDDGKPTGPKAKWWSRPTTARTGHSELEDAIPAEDTTGATGPVEASPAQPVIQDAAPAVPAPDEEATWGIPAVPTGPPAGEPLAPAPRAQPLHAPDEYSTKAVLWTIKVNVCAGGG
ncbi:hypothetical protein ACTU45_18700, partial [Streptomyces sp. 24-1644]